MQCKICDASNPESNNYCGNCGVPINAKEITVGDLMDAGYVKAGDQITCKNKGGEAEATVLADGRIQFGEKVYGTPYEAIEAVRGYRCDSWTCWKAKDSQGDSKPLATFRAILARSRRA